MDDDALAELAADTYTPEGQDIWWRQYRASDDAQRNRMRLHLGLGAAGACS